MKLYKLTDENDCTMGKTQWAENVTHEAKGSPDQPLCSNGWIHAYENPLIAVLLNPIHANIGDPVMWEAEGEIGLRDDVLKCGCRSLTTIRRAPLPEITIDQKVRFAIACAWLDGDVKWKKWALEWLNGKDRSAAEAAAEAWAAAAEAEAWAAAAEAARAVDIIKCAEWCITDEPITALYPEASV